MPELTLPTHAHDAPGYEAAMTDDIQNQRLDAGAGTDDGKAGSTLLEHPSEAIWAVYLSEASRHDHMLIEGWKSDMGAMLIFAGLFSAVVTAFIIESYKSLSPDTRVITVALLAQISNQLANGTNAVIPQPTPDQLRFEATKSAVAVNVLWFLSLGFSLLCALAATLVQQWSKNYIDAIRRRPTLYVRARIRSYLYGGLQRFGMHGFVNAIPMLLHISLFLFLGGLFEFLRPINSTLSYFLLAMLLVSVVLYLGTAIVSAVCHDCPYRIPISTIVWRVVFTTRQLFRRDVLRFILLHAVISSFHAVLSLPGAVLSRFYATLYRRQLPIPVPRIPELFGVLEVFRPKEFQLSKSLAKETERQAMINYHPRDLSALRWTLASLVGNSELEPFIQGIQGLVASPDIGEGQAISMLTEIFYDKTVRLGKRIAHLLESCKDILEPPARRKRRIACLTAIWVHLNILAVNEEELNFPELLRLLGPISYQNWNHLSTSEELLGKCVCNALRCLLFRGVVKFLQRFQEVARTSIWRRILQPSELDENEIADVVDQLPHTMAFLSMPLLGSQPLVPGSSDSYALSLISFLTVIFESPIDHVKIQRVWETGSCTIFDRLSSGLNMEEVQKDIQVAFIRSINSVVNHPDRQKTALLAFSAFLPLIRQLDFPESIQEAIQVLQRYSSFVDPSTNIKIWHNPAAPPGRYEMAWSMFQDPALEVSGVPVPGLQSWKLRAVGNTTLNQEIVALQAKLPQDGTTEQAGEMNEKSGEGSSRGLSEGREPACARQ